MRLRTCATVAAMEIAAALLATGGDVYAAGKDMAVQATPVGVTLQAVTIPRNDATQRGGGNERAWAFGDAMGLTLYTRDDDPAGKSTCDAACTKTFPPMIAQKGASPYGDWSLIRRDDGAAQWAFKGKPLYSYTSDKVPGSLAGAAPRGALGSRVPGKVEPMPKGWQPALFRPAASMTFPAGISLMEVTNVFGQVLVNQDKMTLYAYNGDPKNDKQTCVASTASCGDHWEPLIAAEIANPVGDFTVVTRRNGAKQWAYKGRALYTFSGDLVDGEARGVGVNKAWEVALLVKHYTPPEVTAQHIFTIGYSLTTAKGMTLYRRDAKGLVTSGHLLPGALEGNPTTGRIIGTRGCDAECVKTWRPLIAPAGAQPTGFWSVMDGVGGTKQWAYKGFALYTYTRDKEPGDMTGQDIYDIVIGEEAQTSPYKAVSDDLTGVIPNFAVSMFWTYAMP